MMYLIQLYEWTKLLLQDDYNPSDINPCYYVIIHKDHNTWYIIDRPYGLIVLCARFVSSVEDEKTKETMVDDILWVGCWCSTVQQCGFALSSSQ